MTLLESLNYFIKPATASGDRDSDGFLLISNFQKSSNLTNIINIATYSESETFP